MLIELTVPGPQATKPVAAPHVAYLGPVYELLAAYKDNPLAGNKVAEHFHSLSKSKCPRAWASGPWWLRGSSRPRPRAFVAPSRTRPSGPTRRWSSP